jgi:hypothetical protein
MSKGETTASMAGLSSSSNSKGIMTMIGTMMISKTLISGNPHPLKVGKCLLTVEGGILSLPNSNRERECLPKVLLLLKRKLHFRRPSQMGLTRKIEIMRNLGSQQQTLGKMAKEVLDRLIKTLFSIIAILMVLDLIQN